MAAGDGEPEPIPGVADPARTGPGLGGDPSGRGWPFGLATTAPGK